MVVVPYHAALCPPPPRGVRVTCRAGVTPAAQTLRAAHRARGDARCLCEHLKNARSWAPSELRVLGPGWAREPEPTVSRADSGLRASQTPRGNPGPRETAELPPATPKALCDGQATLRPAHLHRPSTPAAWSALPVPSPLPGFLPAWAQDGPLRQRPRGLCPGPAPVDPLPPTAGHSLPAPALLPACICRRPQGRDSPFRR